MSCLSFRVFVDVVHRSALVCMQDIDRRRSSDRLESKSIAKKKDIGFFRNSVEQLYCVDLVNATFLWVVGLPTVVLPK
jgi:hypothetical protein